MTFNNVFIANNLMWLNWQATSNIATSLTYQVKKTEFNTINWLYTTHFDPEDDYPKGFRNVIRQCPQQSCSGLHSPGRSYSTYLWNDSWFQTFQKQFDVISRLRGLHLEKGKGLSGWRARVKHGKHARIEKDFCCCPSPRYMLFHGMKFPLFFHPGGGGGTPLCALYGDVLMDRVCFLSFLSSDP